LHLGFIRIGMLTRDIENAGTDDLIALTIDGVEFRFSYGGTIGDTPQDDQERGQANQYDLILDPETQHTVPENLNDSSIEIQIFGDDAWRPEHTVVWGERFNGGAVIPLAIETDITASLSTDPSEAEAASLPLRLVGHGTDDLPISRLLMIMTTADRRDCGTDDTINLSITVDGAKVVDFDTPDTPQMDQEEGQANLYFAPVISQFRLRDLSEDSIVLSTNGTDAWCLERFFLFGLDSETGRPAFLVPLVSVPDQWPSRLSPLSKDPNEGKESIHLPILANL
jgi:hypothetical protein